MTRRCLKQSRQSLILRNHGLVILTWTNIWKKRAVRQGTKDKLLNHRRCTVLSRTKILHQWIELLMGKVAKIHSTHSTVQINTKRNTKILLTPTIWGVVLRRRETLMLIFQLELRGLLPNRATWTFRIIPAIKIQRSTQMAPLQMWPLAPLDEALLHSTRKMAASRARTAKLVTIRLIEMWSPRRLVATVGTSRAFSMMATSCQQARQLRTMRKSHDRQRSPPRIWTWQAPSSTKLRAISVSAKVHKRILGDHSKEASSWMKIEERPTASQALSLIKVAGKLVEGSRSRRGVEEGCQPRTPMSANMSALVTQELMSGRTETMLRVPMCVWVKSRPPSTDSAPENLTPIAMSSTLATGDGTPILLSPFFTHPWDNREATLTPWKFCKRMDYIEVLSRLISWIPVN